MQGGGVMVTARPPAQCSQIARVGHETVIAGRFTDFLRYQSEWLSGKPSNNIWGIDMGERTDIELRKKFSEVEPGKRTEDVAAEKADFGNRVTYRQAKRVVDHAEPALVEAVDHGLLQVLQAAKVTEAPPETQRHVAELATQGHRKEARQRLFFSEYFIR